MTPGPPSQPPPDNPGGGVVRCSRDGAPRESSPRFVGGRSEGGHATPVRSARKAGPLKARAFLPAALGCLALAALLVPAVAVAQRFDARRPQTFTVGAPQGDSPAARVDARRSGYSRGPLPTSALRAIWHRSIGVDVDEAPLVGADGEIVVIASRGDVVWLAPEGQERFRTSAGLGTPGPGALLSDGTVVVVDGNGEAVGLRRGAVRFRTRVGERNSAQKAAPLALEDGGVVVAVAAELAALDADGGVRARATLPEPAVWPLVAAQGKVAAVTAQGAIYLWTPGREPLLAGSFGGPILGGVTAADGHTLLAVVEGSRLDAVDLEHGVTVVRGAVPPGTATILLGPPSMRGGAAYLLELVLGSVVAVAVDPAGQQIMRTTVATTASTLLADGGVAPLVAPSFTPTLVDSAGTLAFGTPDGGVGVVAPDGAVETLGEPVCQGGGSSRPRWPTAAPRSGPAFAGFAPAGPGGFVVACANGTIAKVAGP